jgi:non-specific serine/threonine protein kinase
LIRKSQSNNESFNDDEQVIDEDSSEDDERSNSFDDKITKKREKRKGLDLATTLERIEKNFVITDPRLPDNPIVRYL